MSVPQDTKDLLIRLAERYETEEFIKDDPVQFPHEVAKRGGSKRIRRQHWRSPMR